MDNKRLFYSDTGRHNEDGRKLDYELQVYFGELIKKYKDFQLRDIQNMVTLVIVDSVNEEILKRMYNE